MSSILLPFASGFLLSVALLAAIDAQNLFVLRQGLRGEHVSTIVLFCGLSDALLISAGVSGVGAFLAAIPELTMALTVGGAIFLIWYGVMALRRMAAPEAMVVSDAANMSLGQALAAAAAFTFLNPHVYLDTLLLMGAAGAAQPAEMRAIFVGGAVAANFVWFAAVGFGARVLRPVFTRPAAWRVLDALVGVVMLVLATSLIVRAASGLH